MTVAPAREPRAKTRKAARAVRRARPSGRGGKRDQILSLLQSKRMTTPELMTALGMRKPAVLFHLRKLKNDGQISVEGKASATTYGLA